MKPIEGYVRKLTTRTETKPYGQSMINITVWSFQIERYDDNNNLLPPVSIEMKGSKLHGSINEGDKVEIADAKNDDGTLIPKKIFNQTTKSIIENKKQGCAGVLILLIASSLILSYIIHNILHNNIT